MVKRFIILILYKTNYYFSSYFSFGNLARTANVNVVKVFSKLRYLVQLLQVFYDLQKIPMPKYMLLHEIKISKTHLF